MKEKLDVILIASGHLPSGCGETGFETLYNTEIKPLVQAVNKFPRINIAFHYSGVVLYWIERHHPELFMLIEDLLSKKQVEFLGGGFYNPKLPLLPLADKIGQMEMLTTYLRKHFGKRPQGCWLPAAAWEQNLVAPLNSCGMSYTFLEDLQFLEAGVKPDETGIYPPCITEDQGKLLTVFPLAREIAAKLWKGNPESTLETLVEKLEEGSSSVVVFPLGGQTWGQDGEDTDYEKLFQDLSDAGHGIEFSFPAKVHKNLRGIKKVYFSGVSAYAHDGNNTGNDRQFLADHSEAGGIYAKTMYIHTLINNKLRGDKTRKKTALEEIWKAQDSAIFGLGSAQFPGLIHSPVRKAAYRSLIEAEKITREKGKFTPSLSIFDYDLDGKDEYIFQDDKINCCVKSNGAGIFELDYLSAGWNYLDTMSFKKGERRCAFTDWFAPAKIPADSIDPDGIPGGHFCGLDEYETTDMDRVRRRLTLRLAPRQGLPWGDIEIEKTWQLKKNSLSLEYLLRNSGKKSERFVFCPSVDLSFPGAGDRYLRLFVQRDDKKEALVLNGGVTVQNVKLLEFQDIKNEVLINLESSRAFEGRIFNVRSGLSGLEEYQSTCLMPLFSVSLENGKSWKAAITLRISS